MCGIAGISMKPGVNKQIVLQKLKILGLYNITRGRDASGIFINGEIIKDTQEFDDFIEKNILSDDFVGNTILIHTRQGSFGYKKTIDEAHPFMINDNLIFTHNGTIKNTGDLCKKYSVEEKDFNVDSRLLGTLLYTEGSDVLTKYKGAAALAYTYIDDLDTLYLYHGLSRDYKHGQPLEERPLYIMETEYGVFYSSLENSLNAIRENEDEKPLNLNYNKIFKIKNGEFLMDEVVDIDRVETNVSTYTYESTGYHGASYNHYNYNRHNHSRSNPIIVKVGNKNSNNENVNMQLILKESHPIKLVESAKTGFKNNSRDFIYYHQGRYWVAPRTLVDGPIYIRKGGGIGERIDGSSELCFFYRGVLLRDKAAYDDIVDLKHKIGFKNWALNPTDYNFALEISRYSHHPVTNLPEEYASHVEPKYRFAWYSKDKKENHSFTPRFAGRSYTIKNGYLMDIKSSHREKCIMATELDVKNQLIELVSGRAQGGSTKLLLPFRTDNDIETDIIRNSNPGKEEREGLLWFFEVAHTDMKSLEKEWGADEFEALRRFIVWAYKRDFSMDALPPEVTGYMDQILENSVKGGISVGQFLDSEVGNDSKVLLKFYEEVLNDKKELGTRTSSISIAKEEVTVEVDEDEAAEKEFERDEKIEECLVDLENIQSTTFDLINDQESDLAQEVGGILISGVNGMLANLASPLNKYKKKDLEKRVNMIRETKNIENGTL